MSKQSSNSLRFHCSCTCRDTCINIMIFLYYPILLGGGGGGGGLGGVGGGGVGGTEEFT